MFGDKFPYLSGNQSLNEMEKYHIYDEIGKGEFSQVFKGRERKKIEYVAIKRIEKSTMNKVRLSLLIHGLLK